MKQEIHPNYKVIDVKCANCGNTFTVGTTTEKGFSVAICSQCHPTYTGKVTIIDSANRVSKFLERQKKADAMKQPKK